MVMTNDDRMKTAIVLQESARVIGDLNTDVFAIMTFLISTVRDGTEHDLGKWISFYARMEFDKKYGKGASDKAVNVLADQKPKNAEEFVKIMEDLFDQL